MLFWNLRSACYEIMDSVCIYMDDTQEYNILVSFALGASLQDRLSLKCPAQPILLR